MASINFPSASKISKLSACPTTKIPQGTDWIYQDIFNTVIDTTNSPSIQLYSRCDEKASFSEALFQVSNDEVSNHWDNCIDYTYCPTSMTSSMTMDEMSLPSLDSGDEEEDEFNSMLDESDFSLYMNVAPVLIESNISSCTTSTEDAMSFRHNSSTIATTEPSLTLQTLNKRKSSSSIRSLKSLMNLFANHKKQKLNEETAVITTSGKRRSITGTLTKKLAQYFTRRS